MNAIHSYIERQLALEQELNREALGRLVEGIARDCREDLERLLDECRSREAYPTRPTIKLFEGRDDVAPDVWLLVWRSDGQTVEETDIHDHFDSEAAFHVLRAAVEEFIYEIDEQEWRRSQDRLNFRLAKRRLSEGATATIQAPYIHLIAGAGDELAATIHAYYPPLDEMNLFEVRGGGLVRTGSWRETRR